MPSRATATDKKAQVEHVDHHIPAASPNADVEGGKTLPAAFGAIDEETAKYLNPDIVIDEETNQRIKSMLNRRILPFLIITYFFQTFDKGTLAFSSIMGIQRDVGLVGQQYALLGTILYVGILVGEIPANRIIQLFPIAKFLGVLIILWGVLVMCHAACKTWSGLMAVRFLLGLFESAVQPCLMTLTVMYYRREEHPTIISYWYCQQGVQLGVAGLLAYGLTYIENAAIYSWQALFLIVGGLTVIWGCLILVFLPDSPMRAKCFDEETKTLILERLRVNELGVQDKRFKWEQLREAFKDPVVWLYLLMQFTCFLIVGSLAVFSNIIVNGLGFSVRQTQLLNLAQGGWSVLIYISSAWLARWTKQTILVLICFMIVALVGTIVLNAVAVTPATAAGLLIAFYLANCCIVSGNLLWSLVTRNIAGQSKKVTTYTSMFIMFAAGNMVGPQIFQSFDGPRYHTAFSVHIALYALFIVTAILLRFVLMRRNSVRRKAQAEVEGNMTQLSARDPQTAEIVQHDAAFADLTDLANTRSFRYMY